MTDIPISGHIADGLHNVETVMRENFAEHEEGGVQFCVMRHGKVLIDLCTGWSDRKRETEVTPDTLFSVYSSGKVMGALVIAWLAEEDMLGYEQPVKSLWPQMDNHGKGDLTVAQFMSHQAGLSGITNPEWTPEDWYDWDKTIKQLEQQEPLFPPGSANGYHPVTFGFLAGELATRADQYSRTLGEILRVELAEPAGADVWIGLPESEHERCAHMFKPQKLANLGKITPVKRAAFMQKASVPGGRPMGDWRKAEFAGSNCHATAKGLTTLMQTFVDGTVAGQAVISEDIQGFVSQSRIKGEDLVLPYTIDFAAGIMRNGTNFFYGPNAETLGHSGWGGSCVFADPVTGLHGAYVMNRQHNTLLGDVRPRALIDATYAALGEM